MESEIEPSPHNDLLKRIHTKRSHIATYLSTVEPTANRITTLTTFCSAVAALLTGSLTKALGITGPSSPSWQWIAASATGFSIVAGSANQWYKSRDFATRVSTAQATDAKLEALETLLEVGQISPKDAMTRYERYLLEIDFIKTPTKTKSWWRRRVALEEVEGILTQPISGQIVGDDGFVCSGFTKPVPLPKGVHLWLAVEIDGRIWPKESELSVKEDGSWAKTIFEEGMTTKFAVSLFAADPFGHKHIRKWLRSSEKAGKYPELYRMPGMIRLKRVTGLRRDL